MEDGEVRTKRVHLCWSAGGPSQWETEGTWGVCSSRLGWEEVVEPRVEQLGGMCRG